MGSNLRISTLVLSGPVHSDRPVVQLQHRYRITNCQVLSTTTFIASDLHTVAATAMVLVLKFYITFLVGGQSFQEVRERVLNNFPYPVEDNLAIFMTIDVDRNIVHFSNWRW